MPAAIGIAFEFYSCLLRYVAFSLKLQRKFIQHCNVTYSDSKIAFFYKYSLRSRCRMTTTVENCVSLYLYNDQRYWLDQRDVHAASMFIDGHCRATDHTYNTSRNNAASVSVCIAISASLVCSVRPFNQSTTVAMQCVCTVAPAGRPTERSRPVAVAAARLSWRSVVYGRYTRLWPPVVLCPLCSPATTV